MQRLMRRHALRVTNVASHVSVETKLSDYTEVAVSHPPQMTSSQPVTGHAACRLKSLDGAKIYVQIS